jgi:hypothetical protein
MFVEFAHTVVGPVMTVGDIGNKLFTAIEVAADLQPVTGSIWKACNAYGPLGPHNTLIVLPMPCDGVPLVICHAMAKFEAVGMAV